MKYIVRLNPKAFNPITRTVIAARLWEIEQCATVGKSGGVDSEPVIWHCEDIRVNKTPIRELFVLPKQGEKPWQLEAFGICVRGQDNVVEILTGDRDASGN